MCHMRRPKCRIDTCPTYRQSVHDAGWRAVASLTAVAAQNTDTGRCDWPLFWSRPLTEPERMFPGVLGDPKAADYWRLFRLSLGLTRLKDPGERSRTAPHVATDATLRSFQPLLQ